MEQAFPGITLLLSAVFLSCISERNKDLQYMYNLVIKDVYLLFSYFCSENPER